jgi:hypothetical protein
VASSLLVSIASPARLPAIWEPDVTPTKILWGQIVVVLLVALAGAWGAREHRRRQMTGDRHDFIVAQICEFEEA